MEDIFPSGKWFFCDIKHQAAIYGVSWFNNMVQVFVYCFTLLGASTQFVISALLIVSAPLRQRLWRIYYNCHHLHLQHLVLLLLLNQHSHWWIIIKQKSNSETKLNQHWMKAFSLLIKQQNIYCCVSPCMKYIAQCSTW